MDLTTIFYYLDEYCKSFEKEFNVRLLSNGENKRKRTLCLSLSEVVTIIVYYHLSGFKTFKDYYLKCQEMGLAFPQAPSYNRFLELKQRALVPITVLTKLIAKHDCDGVSYIDSFSLKVSHNKRIHSHKVFKGLAARGKTSIGYFFGFKLHLIITRKGEIVDFTITPGNITDNNSDLIEKIMRSIQGKVFGDKGYIVNKPLFEKLYTQGVHIVTKIRSNMKNKLIEMSDKLFLKGRGIIESVGNILKNRCNIEHSRYRNPLTLLINVCAGLMAYYFRPDKPSLKTVNY